MLNHPITQSPLTDIVCSRLIVADSVLLSFFKVLNFTRGFDSFGPLVRMITKIIKDVHNFFVVLGVMLVGFAMAFSVALPEETVFKWCVFTRFGKGLF